MTDVRDDVGFLFQSEARIDALFAVASDGPLDRYDLEGRLDVSRRTVVRTFESLRDRGYVRETDDGYAATALGETMASACEALLDSAEAADRLAPFLRRVSAGTFDLDPTLLADAEVVVPTDASPYAPLDRALQLRAESTTVRELSPIVERRSIQQLVDRIDAGEAFDAEVVVDAGVVAAARGNSTYEPLQRRLRESEQVRLLVHDDVPMLVAVLDGERVALGATDGANPHVCVVSDRPEVIDWAERTYERARDEATTLAGE